ncbi:MAG TPA: DUF1385 domain-containing protein [Acidimicrobiia bacterium]|nr:DUF1385 domain-containing protein [Acidimicrobiia bacterium]
MSTPSPEPTSALTVGGQAVLEGVMMRAPGAWAVAVRRPDGAIESVRHQLPRLTSRSAWAKIPLVRGMLVLAESLTIGFKALSWSAQKSIGEEEEEMTKGQIAGSMTLAIAFFIGLFVVVPTVAARFLTQDRSFIYAAVEGLIQLGIFLGYLWLLGRSEEIRRVFAYHGAEHMSIHAYEAGDRLSVDRVSRYRPEHPRCGTSFLLIVMILAIVIFGLLGRLPWPLLILSRLVGIPLIAGISYEILKASGKHQETRWGRFLAAPGLWLQRLTTRVPEEDQIEVAVASLLSSLEANQVEEILRRGPVPAASLAARATH